MLENQKSNSKSAQSVNLDVTKTIHHEGHEDHEGCRSENLDLSGGNLMSSGVIVRPEEPTLPFSLRALRVLRGEDFVSLGLTKGFSGGVPAVRVLGIAPRVFVARTLLTVIGAENESAAATRIHCENIRMSCVQPSHQRTPPA